MERSEFLLFAIATSSWRRKKSKAAIPLTKGGSGILT